MNHKQYLCSYGDKGDPKECQIVNTATKAFIPIKEIPIILVVNYATLNEDPNEIELLVVSFEMMQHGISVDITPKPYGGNGEMEIDEENIPFEWDEEKLFLYIKKPNEEDMESLETFELNSPVPDKAFETSQA
eukprot:12095787-Ditylum_brightwellii.AAC.2